DDFALAIKKGRAQRNQSYVIHYRPNEFNYVRVGISVSSKLGNAVVRNLVKRQIRSMCDSLIDYNSQSLDIVIVAKANFLDRSYDDNKQSLKELFNF
ncbi:MAG: ribonuclease P protein component, partial [Alphaproteobacteria bacterium]|nr:ribonuclease P protein component [Alphaproteobacteria bacterium]